MSTIDQSFSSIEILSDETNGLVRLDTIERHGQDRATKIKNDFVGHLCKSKSSNALKILELLNNKLPQPDSDEVIVGLPTSGIIMSSPLSIVRDTPYNFGVSLRFGETENIFCFNEDQRDKKHYFYGIKPGDTALIIEDEITTGGGVIGLTTALRKYGVTVNTIASVVETVNFNAREKIKSEVDIEVTSLLKIRLS